MTKERYVEMINAWTKGNYNTEAVKAFARGNINGILFASINDPDISQDEYESISALAESAQSQLW